MEDNTSLIESLLERTAEYGKTSFELAKLKAVDKASDVVSSFIPNAIVVLFILSFMLFVSLGLSLWLGEILGNTYFGFFVVAAFYGITGIFIHLFMHKWIKRCVSNNFIKLVLK
jgi:fatty acid desaturase